MPKWLRVKNKIDFSVISTLYVSRTKVKLLILMYIYQGPYSKCIVTLISNWYL